MKTDRGWKGAFVAVGCWTMGRDSTALTCGIQSRRTVKIRGALRGKVSWFSLEDNLTGLHG